VSAQLALLENMLNGADVTDRSPRSRVTAHGAPARRTHRPSTRLVFPAHDLGRDPLAGAAEHPEARACETHPANAVIDVELFHPSQNQ
jgi:hypothetical protein